MGKDSETLLERLYSDSNLYFAAYLAPTYICNVELLDKKDQSTLQRLKDAYDERTYSTIIANVRDRLKGTMQNPNCYFETEVYFKPKSYKEADTDPQEQLVFRPLHTAKLVDQIAMVAMLQLLVYDVQEDNSLTPSELSRLMPDNFYGNRISFDGKRLFKTWQEQYHAYMSKEDELFYSYHKNRKYRFAVELDLKDFFPSVNPWVIYQLMIDKMPIHYDPADQKTYKKILEKLLFFKLTTPLENEETSWYCHGMTRCTDAKGIPQGLPHSYFLANLLMTRIQAIYQTELPGEMLFYVDDSVIFTNSIKKQADLDEKIERINEKLKILSCDLQPGVDRFKQEYSQDSFVISVHDASSDKTSCVDLIEDSITPDKLYLRGICRETSGTSFDMHSISSEEDMNTVQSRIGNILEAINSEISRVKSEEKLLKESPLSRANAESYLKKLTQYHKFFGNRKLLLSAYSDQRHDEFQKKFLDTVNKMLCSSYMTQDVMDIYTQNDMATLLKFVYQHAEQYTSQENEEIDKTYAILLRLMYGKNKKHAYLEKMREYGQELSKHPTTNLTYVSLSSAVLRKYPVCKQMPVSARMAELHKMIHLIKDTHRDGHEQTSDTEILAEKLGFIKTYQRNKLVRSMSEIPVQQMLNAVASVILGYLPDDSVQLSNQKYEPMQYAEIRILAWLRSRDFSLNAFLLRFDKLCGEEYMVDAEYSILKVLRYFKQYVVEPKRVDELIRIHKLCCDSWKNGSKYLYFYTLHNQEHAVQLIEYIVQLCIALTQLQLKRVDFYLLFASCYLHDLSMVSMPDFSAFYDDPNNLHTKDMYTRHVAHMSGKDSLGGRQQMIELYREMEGYFEQQIRSAHAVESAKAIRTWEELDFIDMADREMIAQISEAHGYQCDDVYRMKAKAKKELVSLKVDCILLRLADVLDICKYRISILLLNHNIDNMNPLSRFHWLSHLITGSLSIEARYFLNTDLAKEKNTYLQDGVITQQLIIRADLLLSQQTPEIKKGACVAQMEMLPNGKGICLHCGGTKSCDQKKCPFICKWFFQKNEYLLPELNALADYLKRLPNQFFKTEVSIILHPAQPNRLTNKQFGYVIDFVEGK